MWINLRNHIVSLSKVWHSALTGHKLLLLLLLLPLMLLQLLLLLLLVILIAITVAHLGHLNELLQLLMLLYLLFGLLLAIGSGARRSCLFFVGLGRSFLSTTTLRSDKRGLLSRWVLLVLLRFLIRFLSHHLVSIGSRLFWTQILQLLWNDKRRVWATGIILWWKFLRIIQGEAIFGSDQGFLHIGWLA